MTPREKFLWLPGPNGKLASMLHSTDSHRLVIMAHGFTGTKCETGRLLVQTARTFATHKMNVLRFDFFGSGDSEGTFQQMSPNTEIADLLSVICWGRKRYDSIGVLGLSFGGAVSICACAQSPDVDALVTWSSVPDFVSWNWDPEKGPRKANMPGAKFFTDRPKVDVPASFLKIQVPRLQVQGDKDIPGFRERFSKYFKKAGGVKKHLVIAGAGHTFDQLQHRKRAIAASVRWMEKYLK